MLTFLNEKPYGHTAFYSKPDAKLNRMQITRARTGWTTMRYLLFQQPVKAGYSLQVSLHLAGNPPYADK